eukprot:3283421-Amphidinium_carterae.1
MIAIFSNQVKVVREGNVRMFMITTPFELLLGKTQRRMHKITQRARCYEASALNLQSTVLPQQIGRAAPSRSRSLLDRVEGLRPPSNLP